MANWTSVPKAAKRVGVSAVTMWRWAVDRRVPSIRPGGPGTRIYVDMDFFKNTMGETKGPGGSYEKKNPDAGPNNPKGRG